MVHQPKEISSHPKQGSRKDEDLYGQEYIVISDPFLEGHGVALGVKTREDPEERTIRLPSTVLQSVMAGSSTKAA